MSNKRRIGIITYSYGCNYGGTLQCLALYNILKKLNIGEVQVINYIPEDIYGLKKKYLNGSGVSKNINENIKQHRSILKKLIIKIRYVDKILSKFNDFRDKNLKMSPIVNTKNFNIISKDFTDIVVGSDQVWNVSNSFESAKIYFLEGIKNLKKISYAACSGRDFCAKDDMMRLKKSIEDFDHILVRNNHTKNLIKKVTEKQINIVADPTVLHSFEEYLKKDKIIKEKYILTYILGKEISGGNLNILNKIKEKYSYKLKVIAIGIPFIMSGGLQFYPWADEVRYDASPEEWLNLINNAEFIYTDSYHGVLFSMKFHKKFLGYYTEKNRADRFIDLGERYEVKDWIINTPEELQNKNSLEKEIDYERIDFLLEKHRVESMEFLKKALGDV